MLGRLGARGGNRLGTGGVKGEWLQPEQAQAAGVVPSDPAQAGGDVPEAGEAQEKDREVPQRREHLGSAAGADPLSGRGPRETSCPSRVGTCRVERWRGSN